MRCYRFFEHLSYVFRSYIKTFLNFANSLMISLHFIMNFTNLYKINLFFIGLTILANFPKSNGCYSIISSIYCPVFCDSFAHFDHSLLFFDENFSSFTDAYDDVFGFDYGNEIYFEF
jgi:hypothetical protein